MASQLWWERPDLSYRDGLLHLANEDLASFARSAGTPTFAYSAARVLSNLARIHAALENQAVEHEVYYALKANRYQPLVTSLRLLGRCGIDVCSPNELLLARQCGFREHEITYTGTSVSNRDLDIVALHPAVQFNCDSISTLKRLGKRCPGRTIGLRINPQMTASHLETISYAGDQATKFGLYPDRFGEALEVAESFDLRVNTLHFHSASGYLNNELEAFSSLLDELDGFLDAAPLVKTIDIGGGLGVPLRNGDQPLDLERWARLVADFAKPRNLAVQVEPGDYLVKDAGVLLVEVNSVEEKGGSCFVGVDAGFNLSNLHAVYDYPLIVAPVLLRDGQPVKTVTLAGNINEGVDTLAEGIALQVPEEGDILALGNLGGYSTSNSSNHCMRGDFQEYLLMDGCIPMDGLK